MRKPTSILFLLIVLINQAFSQPKQVIRGRVVDQESQIPLQSANIMILEAGPLTGVITDEKGLFSIEEVPVGRYSLGRVIGKKYRLLRIAYTVFMIGIILSSILFAVVVLAK